MLVSRFMRLVVLFAAGIGIVNLSLAADGLDPEANSDGFNPAAELYQMGEAGRQQQIARQLELNHHMQESAGYGTRYAPFFEPWPRVPGDVWGYPMNRSVAQPIGHESVQTGPNRWLYRPLYATAVQQPPAAARRAAAKAKPGAKPALVELPHPSDPEPEDFVPPGAKPRQQQPAGPRAF